MFGVWFSYKEAPKARRRDGKPRLGEGGGAARALAPRRQRRAGASACSASGARCPRGRAPHVHARARARGQRRRPPWFNVTALDEVEEAIRLSVNGAILLRGEKPRDRRLSRARRSCEDQDRIVVPSHSLMLAHRLDVMAF